MFTSEATTRGIKVEVESRFDPSRSRPEAGFWFFLYTVTISNKSETTVQLLRRQWVIVDAHGEVEHVEGEGVVGEQPVLEPGEAFQYTSGCPLGTEIGTMHGTYQMVDSEGDTFEVEISPFTLSKPYTVH